MDILIIELNHKLRNFDTQTSDFGKAPNPAMPNTFMAVSIDTYDPISTDISNF